MAVRRASNNDQRTSGSGALRRALILGLPAVGAALALLAARTGARILAAPPVLPTRFVTPWELGIPYEDVQFRTSDGLTLSGWWLPRASAAHTAIVLTGHRAGRSDTLGISGALWRREMNVILFDYRGRGPSDPAMNSLGYYETLDALAAVDYACGRAPETSVVLVGYSMGASVAIMAAARDERICAVVADSPFASQREVIRLWFRTHVKLPVFPWVPLLELFLPYDVGAVEPLREVSEIAPRALMLIHGERDDVTHPLDSEALYRAAGEPKEMWALPNVGHCGAYFVDRTAYVERIASFLERHVGQQRHPQDDVEPAGEAAR